MPRSFIAEEFLIYPTDKAPPCRPMLLGHTKLESTVRYWGIEVKDALELSERTAVQRP